MIYSTEGLKINSHMRAEMFSNRAVCRFTLVPSGPLSPAGPSGPRGPCETSA